MNRRFWCIVCSLFLAYNLKVLFDDFYSVNYKIVEVGDVLQDEVTNIVACTHPNRIVEANENRTENGTEVRPEMVDARSFLNTSIAMIERHLGVKNLFNLDRSYVFRGFLCFNINESSYENDQAMKNFLKLYSVQLFAYSPGKQPFFYEYVYNNYFTNNSLWIIKQRVYGSAYLANSNCRTPRDQFLASKFNCLRECAFNSPVDFHPPDSEKLFNLSVLLEKTYDPSRNEDYHRTDNVSTKVHTKTINNHSVERHSDNETFRKCVKRCPSKDCFRETYNSISLRDDEMKISFDSVIYRAYYSTTHFWLQLFGLLTLFTGTSIVEIVNILLNWTATKLKPKHQVYFIRYLPKIKLGLVICSAAFIVAQSILMIIDYKFEKSFPNRTIIWTFSSSPYSLFICLPVETLIHNDTRIEPGRNSRILDNHTFQQLEERTRAFEKGVESIKLLHGNRMKPINWTLTRKVLFKNSSFNQLSCLSRCFRVELKYDDLRYRKMMPLYYLVVQFRTDFRELYLTAKRQNLTSGLVNFKGDYFVRKTREKAMPGSRKSNCRNSEKPENNRKKIDRCINQKFVANHSLPVNSVFDKDDFDNRINGYKFKEENITAIERDCTETHEKQKEVCEEVVFEVSMNRMNSYGNRTIRLNLNYEDSISEEIDQSPIKVLLHILNLESVFFKTNVVSCLLFLIAVLKRLFRLKWSNGKLDRYLVLSLCSLGFLVHNVFIFKAIIGGQLAQHGYFNLMSEFRLPNAVFCFDLSDRFKLDENHKMTGDHLNNLAWDWRLGNIVEKILYFNKTHDKLFRPENGLTNYSDYEIRISPVSLFDTFHCLEFELKTKFDEEDFYLLHNKFILQISFSHWFANQTKRTFLFYRQSGQKEISDLLEYKIGTNERNGRDPIYEIVLEQIEVSRNDEFENLKDLRRLFFGKRKIEDVNGYLSEMLTKFSEGGMENVTTNEVLLEPQNFHKEIDNQMFKQFFKRVTNVSDHQYPTSQNYKLNYYNFYSKRIDFKGFSYFQFTILPISKRVEILNDENLAKLNQDILNSLSLWLSITIADLVLYFNMAPNIFHKIYSLLIKAQNKLSSFREPQPLDCRELSSLEMAIKLHIEKLL